MSITQMSDEYKIKGKTKLIWDTFQASVLKCEANIRVANKDFPSSSFVELRTMLFNPTDDTNIGLFCKFDMVLEGPEGELKKWVGKFHYGYTVFKSGKTEFCPTATLSMHNVNELYLDPFEKGGQSFNIANVENVSRFHYQKLDEALIAALKSGRAEAMV